MTAEIAEEDIVNEVLDSKYSKDTYKPIRKI